MRNKNILYIFLDDFQSRDSVVPSKPFCDGTPTSGGKNFRYIFLSTFPIWRLDTKGFVEMPAFHRGQNVMKQIKIVI